jgi:phage anti-repressor protein
MQKIFKTGMKRTENEETVTFIHDDKERTATAFTITLRSGEKETFVTNLEKQYLKPQQLGELYFKQWNVSLKLRLLDGQVQHEYITGQTTNEVYIDFWRRTAIANAIEPTKDARKSAIEAEKRARGKHFRQDRNSKDLMESLT